MDEQGYGGAGKRGFQRQRGRQAEERFPKSIRPDKEEAMRVFDCYVLRPRDDLAFTGTRTLPLTPSATPASTQNNAACRSE